MPNPTPSDVHVDEVLTTFSIAYLQGADAFVSGRVFPTIYVKRQSNKYATFTKGDFHRDGMRKRAPGSESAGGGWTMNTDNTYFCDVYAAHKDIDDQTRANADSWAQLDKATSEYLTQLRLIRQEKDWAATYFAGSIWANNPTTVALNPVAGTSVLKWNDNGSTPIEDVRYWKRKVQQSTGVRPNVLTLGRAVVDALLDHPDIIDRLKYGQTAGAPAKADLNKLAQLFEVDEILVMDAIENEAEPGQTASMDFIGGAHALMTYRPPGPPQLMSLMSGATFVWSEYAGSQGSGQAISSFRMQHLKSDRYEIEANWDQKAVCTDLGVFFESIVAY